MALILLEAVLMKRPFLLIPLFASPLLACSDAGPEDPMLRHDTSRVTIHIIADAPPAVVAFREATAAGWQLATAVTPTSFEASVHGPYVIGAVCDFGDGIVVTRQIGRSLEDPHEVDALCFGPADTVRTVTGHMIQDGEVILGDTGEGFFGGGNWDFALQVPDGTYDLFASSTDHIAARRGIAVSGDLALTPDVDVVAQGQPLASVAFSATNATATERLAASVLVGAATGTQLEVYGGPIETALIAPESVLIDSDQQSVSVQARDGTPASTRGRSLRRPFRVGGDTVYTLPRPLGTVQWNLDGNQLGVSWVRTPRDHALFAPALGLNTDHTATAAYTFIASSAFLEATRITSATFATDLPGYRPEWKIDLSSQYHREIDFQRLDGDASATVWESELQNLGAALAAPSPELRASARLGVPAR